MPAYSQTVDTNGVAAYPTAAQIDMRTRFVPDEYALVLEGGTITDFSFDGVSDHGRLVPGGPTESVTWRTKAQRVWLKSAAAVGNVTRVSVSTDV